MSLRMVKLLHVEDDELQRRVMAHHLEGLEGLAFTIRCTDSEAGAIEAFRSEASDFVVLDYQLTQGNGLSCLRRLRELDPVVPIVAVSGTATPEIAAELIQAGADDYISKQELNRVLLSDCVRAALTRADAWRKRGPLPDAEALSPVESQLEQICRAFASAAGPDFLQRLQQFEDAAHQAGLTPVQMQLSFRKICASLEAALPAGSPPVKRLLRPVLLELLLRLFDRRGQ